MDLETARKIGEEEMTANASLFATQCLPIFPGGPLCYTEEISHGQTLPKYHRHPKTRQGVGGVTSQFGGVSYRFGARRPDLRVLPFNGCKLFWLMEQQSSGARRQCS